MKHLLFKYCLCLAVVAAAVTIGIFVLYGVAFGWPDFRILITGLTAIGTAYYFIQKQKLEDVEMFIRLFKEYNARFAALAPTLFIIRTSPTTVENETAAIAEYLDLCCEQYYFKQLDFIYPAVWRTWCNGMLSCCKNERISAYFEKELQNPNEYYGLTMPEIRKGALGK
jgi:hypothetical protein